MLSQGTQRLLAQVFAAAIENEEKVERCRQTLCAESSFSVFSLFRRIDCAVEGSVTAVRLREFLEELGLEIRESDARAIVRQFDSKGDRRLGVEDLAQMVLPAANNRLRETALDRPCGQITYSVLTNLRRLFTHEIQYHRLLCSSLQALSRQRDFSPSAAFHAITPTASITRQSLLAFLHLRNVPADQSSIDAVLRRVDIDGDEEVSMEEFEAMCRGALEGCEETQKTESLGGGLVDVFCFFAETLLVSMRKRAEIRPRLRVVSGFDVNTAFSAFDPSSRGYSSITDFQSALMSCGVNATNADISSLFAANVRYSPTNRMPFSTFSALIFPDVADRREVGTAPKAGFSLVAKALLGDLWITHLFDAKSSFDTRSQLTHTDESSLRELFSILDQNRDACIDPDDAFLQLCEVPADTHECAEIAAALSGGKARVSYGDLLRWIGTRRY